MLHDPEREAQARQILKEIDPLLDVRWMDGVKRYALLCRWPENDRRWELVRSGEIGAPEDVLGWFTQGSGGIQTAEALPVDPLEMMDRIVEWLGKMDNQAQSWKDRMRKTVERNAEVRRKAKQAIIDETMDQAEYYKKLKFSEPTVSLGEGRTESIHQPKDPGPSAGERRVYRI